MVGGASGYEGGVTRMGEELYGCYCLEGVTGSHIAEKSCRLYRKYLGEISDYISLWGDVTLVVGGVSG